MTEQVLKEDLQLDKEEEGTAIAPAAVPTAETTLEKEEEGVTVAVVDPNNKENVPFSVAVLPAIFSGGADYFGLGTIGPILPYYVASMGESENWVGYITSAQFAGVLVGGVVLGRIADVYGSKRTIMFTLAADVLLFTLTGFCKSGLALAACRMFCGFFTPLVSSISWVISSSDVRPTATKNTVGFNMGVWAFCMSACYMMGSVLGGSLGPQRWSQVHISSAAIALLALAYMFIQDEPPRSDAQTKPEGVDTIVKQPEVLALLLNNVALGIIFTGGLVASSLVMMNELGATPGQVAVFFVINSGGHGLVNFAVLPACIKHYKGPWEAMGGSTALALVCAVCFFFDFAYGSLFVFGLLLVLSSMILPICMTSANITCGQYAAKYTKNARTVVLGMARFCFNVGQILGPLLAVILLKWHKSAQFAGVTLFSVITWGNWYFWHHRVEATEKQKEQQAQKEEEGGVELTALMAPKEEQPERSI